MKKNSIIFVGLAIATVIALVVYNSAEPKDEQQLSGTSAMLPTPTQGTTLRGFEATPTAIVSSETNFVGETTKGGIPVGGTTPTLTPQVAHPGVSQTNQVVRLTDNGFLPNSIVGKVGTTVLFINESAVSMRLNEDIVGNVRVLEGFGMVENLGKNGMYEYVLRGIGKTSIANSNKPNQKATLEIR